MSISLEVSIGEALDKLSILEIKKDKIKDAIKLSYLLIEHDYLYNKLSLYIEKYFYFYKMLKKVNLEIWELQDIIRDINRFNTTYSELTEKILNLNDSRFLIKNKLNFLCKSNFIEQKGYNRRILFINLMNLSLTECNVAELGIKYYSLYYDNVIICSGLDIENNYKDDISISVTNNIEEKLPHFDVIDFVSNQRFLKHTFFSNRDECKNENESEEVNKIFNILNLNYSEVKTYIT
jgi:hypothetical protein